VSTFNYERAAKVLADAAIIGDVTAAQKYQISTQSIKNWRKRLESDPSLAQFFDDTKVKVENNWLAEIPQVLSAFNKFFLRAAELADPKDPRVIEAMASGVKALAGIKLTQQVIDAGIAQRGREEQEERPEVASAPKQLPTIEELEAEYDEDITPVPEL
jgi:hypothetical protein